MNRIPGTLRVGIVVGVGAGVGAGAGVGTGAGAGTSAGMLIKAVRKHQVEVVALK